MVVSVSVMPSTLTVVVSEVTVGEVGSAVSGAYGAPLADSVVVVFPVVSVVPGSVGLTSGCGAAPSTWAS